jgi:hypothetical protein
VNVDDDDRRRVAREEFADMEERARRLIAKADAAGNAHMRSVHERMLKLIQNQRQEHEEFEREQADRRAEEKREAASPVQRGAQAGPLKTVSVYLGIILVGVLLLELVMTIAQFTGNDMEYAKARGQAKVISCQRHGPIGEGFGYWDECTAEVTWDNGVRENVTIDKRGFFSASEIGTTVRIGDLGYHRGGRSFARPELPPRLLVDVVGVVLGVAASLILLFMAYVLWSHLRDGLRKLGHRS